MTYHEVLEITLKRTLQLASLAAVNGEITNSRHFGKQFKQILLETCAVTLGIPPVDMVATPPLKMAKVRRFYHKKLRSKKNNVEKKRPLFIDMDEISQLFCPFCWVYLTSKCTLGTKINLLQEDGKSVDILDITSKSSATKIGSNFPNFSTLSVCYYCKACGSCLPDYQFNPE